MKRMFAAASVAALMGAGSAQAATIAVSMQSFDNNFQTLLRQGIQKRADAVGGVTLQVEDAQTDVAKQLNQGHNFIASGVDAIIVTLADTSAAPGITSAAEGIPLVYLNLQPTNIASLPANEAYVGSREAEAGALSAKAACDLLKAKGKAHSGQVYILMGELAHKATRKRTQSAKETLAAGDCKGATIADEQPALWQRTNALDLTTNWITVGRPMDAILANMDDVVVTGIDATADGLAAMQVGDLDVTAFQNATGQAASAVDTALALAHGDKVQQQVMVPFELVTPQVMAEYAGRS